MRPLLLLLMWEVGAELGRSRSHTARFQLGDLAACPSPESWAVRSPLFYLRWDRRLCSLSCLAGAPAMPGSQDLTGM